MNECRWSNPAWAAALDGVPGWLAEQEEFIRRIDPVARLAQAAPRALFLLNGDFDTDQPKHYAIETYGSLRSAYAATPERLRLGIYPAGHTLTEQMQADVVEWFARFLPV